MNSSHAPFLAAILDDADSDAPRLRYADFLDETAEPVFEARAEFIRVQCALEGLATDDSRYEELLAREEALLHAWWQSWFEPIELALAKPSPPKRGLFSRRKWPVYQLTGFHRYADSRVNHQIQPAFDSREHSYSRFRRGFVDRLIVRGLNLSETKTDFQLLFHSTPLTELDVQGINAVESIIRGAEWCRLQSLSLCPAWGESLLPLAEAEFADRLRELKLVVWEETDDPSFVTALQTLTGPNRFVGLTSLDLTIYNRWFDLPELIGSSLLNHLEALTIRRPLVSLDFLRGLLRHEIAPRLQAVSVRLCEDVPFALEESLRHRFGDRCRLGSQTE